MKFLSHSTYRVLKTVLATVIAIKIAEYFNMRYHLTAGVVAIISLQSTIKATYKIGIERLIATTIGLVISSLLFYFIGINVWILGLFILIFMPICLKFNLVQGFLVNIVLATHFIMENSVTLQLFFNEFALLLIGLLTAFLLNLYMPNLTNEINDIKKEIGKEIQRLLLEMAKLLEDKNSLTEEYINFSKLKKLGFKGKNLAAEQNSNSLFLLEQENTDYFRMRYIQYKILKRIKVNFQRINRFSVENSALSKLIEKLSYTTFNTGSISQELLEIENTKQELKNSELPKTREEFEHRALLYGFFIDLEEYANVGLEFTKKYHGNND